MLVSVIIPFYNGKQYLRDALDSVFSQTYRPLEVMIIDDGSSEDISDILHSYSEIVYVWQKNQGNAAARMKGVALSSGELIAFLDQDDQWSQNKIQLQVEAFSKDPTLEYVIGMSRFFLDEKSPPPENFKLSLLDQEQTGYLPGTLMVRKELLKRFPFHAHYRHGSDADWFFRMKESHIPMALLPEVLLYRRIHSSNLSHQIKNQYQDLLHAIKASLDRKPLVSVIIPVHNGEKYLKEAIESVLSQSYLRREILIIDDGSTDTSRDIALQFQDKVRYFFQKNGGIGDARNTGIRLAKGDFFAFLDADDLWTQEKLSLQIVPLLQDQTLDMVFGEVIQFLSPELEERLAQKIKIPSEVVAGLLAGGMLIRRRSFLKVGFFNVSVHVGEFIDWYMRAKEQGLQEKILQAVVLKRRIHNTNTSLQKKESQKKDFLSILKNSLDRKRQNNTNEFVNTL